MERRLAAAVAGLVLWGCAPGPDQALLNEAYSLNDAWQSLAQTADNTERHLLVSEATVKQNLQQFGLLYHTTGSDSASQAATTELARAYQATTRKLAGYAQNLRRLQQRQQEAHSGFTDFLNRLEANKLDAGAARSQLEQFARKNSRLVAEMDDLSAQLQNFVRDHNALVVRISDTQGAYALSAIDVH